MHTGLLFRIGIRLGGAALLGVLVLGIHQGASPADALLHALLALSVFAGCGWAAEQSLQLLPAKPPADIENGQDSQSESAEPAQAA